MYSARRFVICIEYETSPEAGGLQWLSAEQTAGKRQPYMFSQFQPTYARSMVPCQDTPSVKIPYRAKVTNVYMWISGPTISRQYKADPTDRLIELVPLI